MFCCRAWPSDPYQGPCPNSSIREKWIYFRSYQSSLSLIGSGGWRQASLFLIGAHHSRTKRHPVACRWCGAMCLQVQSEIALWDFQEITRFSALLFHLALELSSWVVKPKIIIELGLSVFISEGFCSWRSRVGSCNRSFLPPKLIL